MKKESHNSKNTNNYEEWRYHVTLKNKYYLYMKKYLYISFISFMLISCGGGGDDPVLVLKNTAPTTPILVAPTNNKLCIDSSVNFQWDVSTDSNKDPITYQIQVAKDNQFSQIVKTLESPVNYQTILLEKGIAYYWRVKATDSKSLSSSYSSTYNFYTEAVAIVNHLPFSPDLVQPSLNSELSTTKATLKWSASDVDASDILTYDVFFGTDNPPISKVNGNLATNTLDVDVLPSKEYYWKVVVKDNKGGETIGQTWKFKTH